MQMSEEAKRALTNATDWNQGTALPESTDRVTRIELQSAGLLGEKGCLSMKGSIAAERLQRAQLDDLFGKL